MVLSLPSAPFAGALLRGAAGTVLAALAVLLPGMARAVEAPDPALLAALGARCDSAGMMRVVTHRSSRIVHRLRLEPDAVVLLGPGRVALIEVGTPPEKRPTRIPWTDVESLSLGRSRTGQGLLTGALVGATLGGIIVGTYGTDLVDRGDDAVVYFAVLVGLGCAGIGTLFGAGSPQWTSLYP